MSEKRCWDCEYYQSYDGDDYLCNYPDEDNFSWDILWDNLLNGNGECPYFKVKL